MGGLLLGFALGAMAFTEQGREIGNMIGSTAFTAAKKGNEKCIRKQIRRTTCRNRLGQ